MRTYTGAVIGYSFPSYEPASAAVTSESITPESLAASQTPLATPALTAASPTDPGFLKKIVVIPPTYPLRFSIPSLGINAKVQYVGITAKGTIGSPSNFTDVGWYENSATPGLSGSALIDGHVDNGLGLPGVFKHLSNINVGDHVYITTEEGTNLDFLVSSVNSYNYQQVPLTDIMRSTDSRLVLITCEGNWVGDQRTYDKRLVIVATLQK